MVAMWAIALGIVIVQRDLGAALLFFAVFLLLLYVSTARISFVVLGLGGVRHRRRAAVLRLRPRPDADRHLARPVRRPAGRRLPGRPGAARVRARRAHRDGARRRAADDRRAAADPGAPHRLPVRRARRGAGPRRDPRDPRACTSCSCERGLRIASAAQDEFRAILAAGLSLVIGVQAFIIAARQPQADPADRHHAAVRQLRRLVAARERGDRRAAASRSPSGRASRSRRRAGSAGSGGMFDRGAA